MSILKNSILEHQTVLSAEINQVAEVAGYLWQKGWAERNGGNIVINITDKVDNNIEMMKPLLPAKSIGMNLPYLKHTYFYCKGTNKRMRDLARLPMDNGSIIHIGEATDRYEIIADKPVIPTSELPSHLAIHNYFIQNHINYKASLHTHPIELVAMSHYTPFLKKDVLTHLLWSMIPETKAFCPKGLGIIPYHLPGSVELAESTLKALDEYDVVLWEKHGVCAVGENIMEAFDMVDTLTKSARIYIESKNMGFEPEGMSLEQLQEMTDVFHLPK